MADNRPKNASPRPLTPGQLAVEKAAETIERELIFGMAKSVQFYRIARELVNPYSAETRTYRKDFSVVRYNTLYHAIDTWWRRWDHLKLENDCGIAPTTLAAYIIDWRNQEKLLPEQCAQLEAEIAMETPLMAEMTLTSLVAMIQSDDFKHWLEQRAITHAAVKIKNQWEKGGLTLDQLGQATDAARAMTTNHRAEDIVNGFDVLMGESRITGSVTTSIQALNKALGGGFRKRQATIIAGINAGGKTVLTCQIAYEMAATGSKVVIFTTERPPAELIVRMVSSALTIEYADLINRDEIKQALSKTGGTFSTIPEYLRTGKEKAGMCEFKRVVGENLRFVDWSKNQGLTIRKDLGSRIRQLENTGWAPDVIFFDWLGGGLDPNMKLDTLRMHYMQGIDHLVGHGKEFDRIVIVTAQLDKMKVRADTKRTTMDMVSECKAITNNVSNFIGISSLRSECGEFSRPRLEPKQFLSVDKATLGEGGTFPVKQNFRFQRFENYNAGEVATDQAVDSQNVPL